MIGWIKRAVYEASADAIDAKMGWRLHEVQEGVRELSADMMAFSKQVRKMEKDIACMKEDIQKLQKYLSEVHGEAGK